jgi:hypothetical protein
MRVTFAVDYTTPGGRKYNAGTTTDIANADARSLIVRGKARRAAPDPVLATAEDTDTTNDDEGA